MWTKYQYYFFFTSRDVSTWQAIVNLCQWFVWCLRLCFVPKLGEHCWWFYQSTSGIVIFGVSSGFKASLLCLPWSLELRIIHVLLFLFLVLNCQRQGFYRQWKILLSVNLNKHIVGVASDCDNVLWVRGMNLYKSAVN